MKKLIELCQLYTGEKQGAGKAGEIERKRDVSSKSQNAVCIRVPAKVAATGMINGRHSSLCSRQAGAAGSWSWNWSRDGVEIIH